MSPRRSHSPSPSLESRIKDYTYHPAVRWLTRHSSTLAISTLLLAFILLTLNQILSTISRWNAQPSLGGIATENRICSQIGADLLKEGGTAADAMVGAMFCVGVVAMYHSGIGGGGFALVRDKEGRYESVDFREMAPAGAWQGMYEGNEEGSRLGGLAIGVPGELRGLQYLHSKYGRLSWPSLLIPSIRLARDGFTVTSDLERYMSYASQHSKFLTTDASWAMDFAPNGTLVKRGDRLTRKRYAATLQKIAQEGADTFYTGPMAWDTIEAIRLSNGSVTLSDLAAYKVISRPAVEISYRDYKIYGCGAPASGAVALSALKTVGGYEDIGEPSAFNLSTHRLDEALRYAYAARGSLGDPDFVASASAFETSILSPAAASSRRSEILDDRTLPVQDYYPSSSNATYSAPPGHGTSHLVTADSSGLAISLTSTVNLIFGSQLIVPTTGVILNNQMNDFSIPGRNNSFAYPPSPANFIRPHKRPLSSLTPTIVEHAGNGSLYYVVGAAGGSRIISATVQNLWHVLDRGLGVREGLGQGRFHDQLLPDKIGFEWGLRRGNESEGKHPAPENPGVGRGVRVRGGTSGAVEVRRSTDREGREETELPMLDSEGDMDGEDQMGAWREESGIGTGSVEGFDNRTVAFMKARGHNVEWLPPGFSSAQAILWHWNGTFEAAGEPRQADSGGIAV